MEENNFRNYTVSAKVTANQKNQFIEKATNKNLSLSEWIASTLDMSIESDEKIFKLKIENNKLKFSNNHLTQYIKKLEFERYQNKENIITSMFPNVMKQTAPELKNDNKISSKEINYLKSTANGFNAIGVIAILGTILFKSN